MALKVYDSDEVRNALLAAEQANRGALLAAGDDKEFTQGYREGYRDALTTIALAFGLVQPEPVRQTAYVLAVNR